MVIDSDIYAHILSVGVLVSFSNRFYLRLSRLFLLRGFHFLFVPALVLICLRMYVCLFPSLCPFFVCLFVCFFFCPLSVSNSKPIVCLSVCLFIYICLVAVVHGATVVGLLRVRPAYGRTLLGDQRRGGFGFCG